MKPPLSAHESSNDAALLDQMYRLRKRDQFDEIEPTYILALSDRDSDVVIGCARLLPTTGPTMLGQVFPQLLSTGPLGAHPLMIESSRFCVDTACPREAGEGALRDVTFGMFAGVLEWCLIRATARSQPSQMFASSTSCGALAVR
ncbi:acyl-homoserine-lactone synthase (plasmid) [Rhizobium beringeri]|nr:MULTISPECIES: acyl-homoserine-lactone synthase [Rhizobium]WSG93223.1 acyl-homoserine-lactone synthase [Rhizobium beringeri]